MDLLETNSILHRQNRSYRYEDHRNKNFRIFLHKLSDVPENFDLEYTSTKVNKKNCAVKSSTITVKLNFY